ncbi:hypothetical protein LTR62_004692 [Meristemomyces frigidus]|uniref:Uncharacterized protein n=1 Tax=Meristemomyces frigidus TaxID=1508187 RepID=A0AAN7THC6_9PEZI|nr:hypothetical protein LTR62_004692 [Meristemomyces frigidus]
MIFNTLADETSQLALSDDDDSHGTEQAAKRIVDEARKAPVYAGRSVRDVTEDFATAAKRLPAGRLVKDEYFTLFEAVGALEIMDPKMDSGFVPDGDSSEPDFDVCRGLLPTEVLWIMDELLGLMMGWHDGYPLSQTIFTSLHVDRLLSPDNKPPYTLRLNARRDIQAMSTTDGVVHIVLRAYCLALLKSCALVLHTVQSQNFYEEEDFVTHTFGRELVPKWSASEAIDSVGEAVDWLAAADLLPAERDALAARLDFTWTYTSLLTNNMDDWQDLSKAQDHLKSSHDLGKPVPEAFSDKVQRQLATSTPPRPMIEISWTSTCNRWQEMCADISAANQFTVPEVAQNPHTLQRAVWAFAYRSPPPNTFARAQMQCILYSNEQITENIGFFDLLLMDIRDLVLAGSPLVAAESFAIEVVSDSRHKSARIMEVFMDKVFDEFMNLFRIVCQNRCRMRRSLTQSVGILDRLEGAAMDADAELETISPTEMSESGPLCPLTCWVKYQKLQVMTWTIQLGFETDIYLPHEMGMMYWLLSWSVNRKLGLLAHIETFLLGRMRAANGMRDTVAITECVSSQDLLRTLSLQAQTTHSLSTALWHLYELLAQSDAIAHPKQDYAQKNLLYEARMKPYLNMTHDTIPCLADYKSARSDLVSGATTASCAKIDILIKEAKGHLVELKQMSPQQARYVGTEEQWRREIKQLETTCVAIVVQTSQLGRLAAVKASLPVPAKRYHDWWIVPQLRSGT